MDNRVVAGVYRIRPYDPKRGQKAQDVTVTMHLPGKSQRVTVSQEKGWTLSYDRAELEDLKARDQSGDYMVNVERDQLRKRIAVPLCDVIIIPDEVSVSSVPGGEPQRKALTAPEDRKAWMRSQMIMIDQRYNAQKEAASPMVGTAEYPREPGAPKPVPQPMFLPYSNPAMPNGDMSQMMASMMAMMAKSAEMMATMSSYMVARDQKMDVEMGKLAQGVAAGRDAEEVARVRAGGEDVLMGLRDEAMPPVSEPTHDPVPAPVEESAGDKVDDPLAGVVADGGNVATEQPTRRAPRATRRSAEPR